MKTQIPKSLKFKGKSVGWMFRCALLCSMSASTAGVAHAYDFRAKETFKTTLESKERTRSLDEIVITGTVRDDNGETLPGVSIMVKGTAIGTVTDIDGRFSLEVPSAESILVFSFVGMETQEVQVGARTTVNVELNAGTRSLDEVVVVGYGSQRRSDLTGSVGVVGSEDLLREPVGNVLQGLKGKVAGVNVNLNSGSPTSSPRVIIRGLGTVNASSDPLYVVDGVVMEDIRFMNPNDIESLEVLKDASATAIYGSRGANGVIMVTTKRGSKTDGIVVGYEGFVNIGVLPRKMDMMNSEEYLEVVERGFNNHSKYSSSTPPVFSREDPRLFDANGNPLYDTDWQDEATRTAVSHNHQISIQQGGERSSVGAFFNYSRMEGIMLNSWMERINGKIAYDASPKSWLSMGVNLMVNHTTENEVEEGGGGQVPRRTMLEMPPIFPVKFPDGSWSNSAMISDPYNIEPMANPVHVLQTQERLRNRTQIFGNTHLTFHLAPGLDLRTQFGFDVHERKFQDYGPTDLINISAPLGYASINNQRSTYWQEETYLTYNKEIGDHRINAVLGLSWQGRTFEGNFVEARGFSDNFFRYNRIQAASQPEAPQSQWNNWTMNSYFLRGSYTLKDRYLMTLTGRIDGSSRFGDNNKYGVFPSAGLGWIISNEPFMAGASGLDELKFRSSFGITGNTEIPMYQSLGTVSSGTVLINGSRASHSFVNRLPNPDLSWEKTNQFDVGFDMGLFNRRLTLAFDYYYKLTTDLLLDRPVPFSTGFSAVRDNIGSISNQGVEMLLTGYIISRPEFSWESTLNFNYNVNRIESLGENNEDIFPGPNWVSGSQTILRVGEPLSSFWGFERLGTWGTDEAAEAAAAGRVPGEAKRSANPTIIGNGLPKWNGALINNVRYKNWDFSLEMQFVWGVDVLQQFLHSVEDRTGIANTLRTSLYDSWTETNQNTNVQQIRNAAYSGQNSEIDDHWVADGSYIRGNLISLGYTFDRELISRLNINNLRVYTSVQNAFLISSSEFKGFDPESSSWGGNQWGQNIFFFQYPRPRTFTLGVSVQF
ncbi:SusC/RagA family TonB-linked outer membrane protein [Anditalea andensis]|uniref:Collagen-binding protein n=1 Tax=Anditalea andensis TaxID=1048983 RepID=A0A074L6W2_9BACT|nr:TonB-dependent receptor [Anditalea andensis]KEO75558.1 collagen-binding protein [Anditalea andensis]